MTKEPTQTTEKVLPELKRRERKAPDTEHSIANISYQSLFELYVRECHRRNLAEETISGYKNATRYFLDFAGYDLMCAEVTQDLINEYCSTTQHGVRKDGKIRDLWESTNTVLLGKILWVKCNR